MPSKTFVKYFTVGMDEKAKLKLCTLKITVAITTKASFEKKGHVQFCNTAYT